MKMKTIFCTLVLSLNAFAQNPPAQSGNGQAQPQLPGFVAQSMAAPTGSNPVYQECEESVLRYTADASTVSTGISAAVTPATNPATYILSPTILPKIRKCKAYQEASELVGGDLNMSRDMKMTQDGKMGCIRKSGFTADYNPCVAAVGTYDQIVVLEAAMNLTQRMRTDQANKRMAEEVNQRSAQGDAQNAAFDAAIAANRQQSAMNQEQAMAYMAAVAMLYSKIRAWPKKDSESLQERYCSGQSRPSGAQTPPPAGAASTPPTTAAQVPAPECPNSIDTAHRSGDMIANEQAKAFFIGAAMQYAQKGLAAGLSSRQLSKIAKQTEEVKDQTEVDEPAMFERCVVSPMDPACRQPGTRTPGSTFQPGDFSLGDGAGNNVFNPELIPVTGGILDEQAPVGDSETVSDVISPFEEDAKLANSILDPAAAASLQPGSGDPGAAGGGAGGGGGGGSAQLGDDLEGADDGSDVKSDIKSNKANGNYAFGAGGGFQGIKGGKEDANPFASLFDSKTKGGVEEDRSIASDSLGKDSGLFKRISKKYEQIQSDKRIEANNLE